MTDTQEIRRQSFEDRTIDALDSILSKVAEIDKTNSELKAKFEMLEKSISGNLDDLHSRVKDNRIYSEKIEEKYEKKISDLDKEHSEKISKLEQNQNKILGAAIVISSIGALAVKFIQ